MQDQKKYKEKRQLAALLVYSLDPSPQRAKLEASKKKREQQRKQTEKAVKAFRDKAVAQKLSLKSALEQAAITDHLQAYVSKPEHHVVSASNWTSILAES